MKYILLNHVSYANSAVNFVSICCVFCCAVGLESVLFFPCYVSFPVVRLSPPGDTELAVMGRPGREGQGWSRCGAGLALSPSSGWECPCDEWPSKCPVSEVPEESPGLPHLWFLFKVLVAVGLV
uniref:Uncharacterized protein n=1 Tax=Pipistrellus kuhlii TaxID=59472 RepID=A0A7J7TPW8_PIPKU|nr:hypothetical protein mPipKuh1_009290 [Pipistrellus kuhlii]